MTSPLDQSRYQVRFEWGAAGLARLAASDIVVVVDVLHVGAAVIDRVGAGERMPWGAAPLARSAGGADANEGAVAVVERAVSLVPPPLVLIGALRNASAVADAVLAAQHRRAARTSTAVIACGARVRGAGEDPAAPRFAVEDLLGAGAIIDALGERALDHTSPEAAAACEAFRGLRGATRHLLTASGSGQELFARDGDDARDRILAAAAVDAVACVPVLRDGVFVAV